MTDTPLTDETMKYCFDGDTEFVKADFARKLERKLNAANQRIQVLEGAMNMLRQAKKTDSVD